MGKGIRKLSLFLFCYAYQASQHLLRKQFPRKHFFPEAFTLPWLKGESKYINLHCTAHICGLSSPATSSYLRYVAAFLPSPFRAIHLIAIFPFPGGQSQTSLKRQTTKENTSNPLWSWFKSNWARILKCTECWETLPIAVVLHNQLWTFGVSNGSIGSKQVCPMQWDQP